MRKPSEYLAAAVRRVQSNLMSDCALTLTHGADSATVARATSQTRGEDDLSGDSPSEQVRVLAAASDFSSISKGDIATLGDDTRIVTSIRTDVAGASMYVGLSKPLEPCAASFTCVRSTRTVRYSVGTLALCNGLATDVTDGFAPTSVYSWTLCIATDDWPDASGPQIGDTVRFDKDGKSELVKVTRCERRDRRFVIAARSR